MEQEVFLFSLGELKIRLGEEEANDALQEDREVNKLVPQMFTIDEVPLLTHLLLN